MKETFKKQKGTIYPTSTLTNTIEGNILIGGILLPCSVVKGRGEIFLHKKPVIYPTECISKGKGITFF